MNIGYVMKMDNISSNNKIINIFRKKIKVIKKEEDTYFYVYIDKKFNTKKLRKIGQRINKKIYEEGIKTIVLSDDINPIKEIREELINNNVLDGRWLFNYLILDTIEYVLDKKKKPIEESEISILVNETSDVNIQNIQQIAGVVKNLNIVTNNIDVFKQIEDKLYNDLGIAIRVTNNKRKSLIKSDVIINLDFNDETIAKYTLPPNGIVVNINRKVALKKRFNGINISNYKISVPVKYKLANFKDNVMYESKIYSKTPYENIIQRIKKDDVKVLELIGNNGIIQPKEYV